MKKIIKSRNGYFVILPTFILVALFIYYPFLQAIHKSFYDWNGAQAHFIGFDNYKRMIFDPELKKALWNQLIIILVSIVKVITIPLIVARFIFTLNIGRLVNGYKLLLLLPMIIPWIVIAFTWRSMYDTNGIINSIATLLGLEQFIQVWLGDPDIALGSFLFIGFPWAGGIAFLIYLAGFQGIDQSVLESAKMDGTNTWNRFFRVEFPLIRSQLRILLVLTTIDSLKGYAFLIFLTNGGPAYSTLTPGVWIYHNAFLFSRFGYASAIGVVMLIVTALLSWVMIRATRRTDI
ncbi:carbohydrate ABC transporter permease [Paenibacillus sp. N3.4]|uniref:carbohydrate ABC transporter permease n=1 Tax=Paenibacillus sp. N3.4 TaxID=2603222 RepID=UPI001C9CDA3F|nr:sugar ABC transporter permease [Paenibacillus sp. N3.4]